MKITFVLAGGFERTGGDRAIATFASGLIERGHDVLVVSPPRPPVSLRNQFRSVRRGQGWIPRALPGPSHYHDMGVPMKQLERYRPVVSSDLPDADLVIATWWETAQWIWRMDASKGSKVHFFQDYETWGGAVEDVDAACSLPIPKIVTSSWLDRIVRSQFHQSPAAVTPYSVDPRTFFAGARGKQRVPTFGFTYATVHGKGIDIAVRAIAGARQSIPELQVLSCGNTPVSKELPLPPGTQFFYRASNEQLRQLYGRCDAWLFPSRREGFGLPVLEAIACHTPVIATPAGAASEILGGGGGILIPPEDPAAMARAIVDICRLPELDWTRLSDAALRRAAEYAPDASTSRFESALVQIARNS